MDRRQSALHRIWQIVFIFIILVCCGSSHDYRFWDNLTPREYQEYLNRQGFDIYFFSYKDHISLYGISTIWRLVGDMYAYVQVRKDLSDVDIEVRAIYTPYPSQELTLDYTKECIEQIDIRREKFATLVIMKIRKPPVANEQKIDIQVLFHQPPNKDKLWINNTNTISKGWDI